MNAKRSFLAIAAATAAILALSPAARAVPGGELGTLELGRYLCELPGDATGPVGVREPGYDFTIVSASSYRADGRIGSYLLTGDELAMTSGAREGLRFHRMSRGSLRLVSGGEHAGRLRCVLTGSSRR